jgi:predicted nucleic acid-binding protein
MDSVYIETTIVGHIAGRIHSDPFVAARQQVTRDWWQKEARAFEIFISQLVIEKCSEGDPSAAAERLEVVKDLDLLESFDEVDELAAALLAGKAVPTTEPRDAFHIAIAAVNGVDYLLTWNCKHIANATLRSRIEQVCRDTGLEPPIICTPDELVRTDDGS